MTSFANSEWATAKPAKRYQVYQLPNRISDACAVMDTWTKQQKGVYATKAQAQARARTLNSRNGGK